MTDIIPIFNARATATINHHLHMCEARKAYIAELIAWLRHSKPSREDAMAEVNGTTSLSTQLVTLNTP